MPDARRQTPDAHYRVGARQARQDSVRPTAVSAGAGAGMGIGVMTEVALGTSRQQRELATGCNFTMMAQWSQNSPGRCAPSGSVPAPQRYLPNLSTSILSYLFPPNTIGTPTHVTSALHDVQPHVPRWTIQSRLIRLGKSRALQTASTASGNGLALSALAMY
jgi:hypothetical protein